MKLGSHLLKLTRAFRIKPCPPKAERSLPSIPSLIRLPLVLVDASLVVYPN